MPASVLFSVQWQLYDGSDTNAALLAAVSGRSLADVTTTTYKSSEHHMLLHLKTDESGSGRGFQATFELGRTDLFSSRRRTIYSMVQAVPISSLH